LANQQPTYQAYAVVKREGQDDFWLNIGAAFMHSDGDGYNVVLQSLPINGKVVLRLPKEDRRIARKSQPLRPPSEAKPKANPTMAAINRSSSNFQARQ
jgi:hypothetical protein